MLAEIPDNIILKQIALLVLVETAEDGFEHVFVDHEAREDVVGPDPFVEGREDQPLVALGDRGKGLRQGRVLLGEDDADLLLGVLEPILVLVDQLVPVEEGYSPVLVEIHQLDELLHPHHRYLPLLVSQLLHQEIVKVLLVDIGISIFVDQFEGVLNGQMRRSVPTFQPIERLIDPVEVFRLC